MKNRKLAVACSVLTATALTFSTAMPGSLTVARAADGSTATASTTASTTSGNSVQDTIANIMDSMNSTKSGASKQETVYVITGADGSVQKTIVSDQLKNADGADTLVDTSNLADIESTDGASSFTTGKQGLVNWTTDGSDVYYQGTSSTDLPVTMKVTYMLDGKTVSPEDLAGKSGKVTIRFDYTNNSYSTETIDGEQVKVYTPFLMLTGLIMDNDSFSNISVSNGKIIDDGDHSIVMGYALPGMQESLGVSSDDIDLPDYVEITADATDFKLTTAVTMATTEQFANVDTDDLSVGDISNSLSQLTDAMSQLMDGSSSLYDGLEQLATGASQVDSGVQQLNTGANTLASGTSELQSKTASLPSSTQALADGASQLASGLSSAQTGTGDLEAAAIQVDDGLDQLTNGTSSATGLKDAVSSIGDASTSGTLINGVAQVKGGITQVIGTNGSSTAASTGLWQAKYGAIDISKGMTTAVNAIGDASTSGTLENGVAQVKGGITQVIGTNGSSTAASTGLWQAKYGAIDIATGAGTAIAVIGDASTANTLLYGSTHISGGVAQVIGTDGGNAAGSSGLYQARYAASGISDGMSTAINSIGDASASGTLLNGTAATGAFLNGASTGINKSIVPALTTASNTIGAQTDTTADTAVGAINVAIGDLKASDMSAATTALTNAGTELTGDASTFTGSATALSGNATALSGNATALSGSATALEADAVSLNTASGNLDTAATDLGTISAALSGASDAKTALAGIDTTGMTAEQIAAIRSAEDSLANVADGQTAATDASTNVSNARTTVGTAAKDVTNARTSANDAATAAGGAATTAGSAATAAGSAATAAGNGVTAIGNLGTALQNSSASSAITALTAAETKALTSKGYLDAASQGIQSLVGNNDVAAGTSAKAAITDAIYTNSLVTSGLTTLKGSATDTSGSLYAAKNAADGIVSGLGTSTDATTAIGALTAVGTGANSITDGLTTLKGSATDTSGSLYAAKNGANAIASGMGDTADVKTAIGALTTINAGNDSLTAGLEQLKGQPTDTSGSLYAAKNGADAIAAGLGDTSGATTAIGALTTINKGNDSILSGLTTLKSGGTAPDGRTSAGLTGAVAALGSDSTSGTLLYGTNAIRNGLGSLYAGITSASTGSNQLAAGTAQLNAATPTLVSGIEQVNSGAGQIASGTSQLAANTPTLASGAQTAADGSKQLSDGLTQFNDEGVQKLVDAFGGDTEKMLDRLTPIINAGKAYDNYSGINSDMTGSVKFIFRSDSIGD